MIKTIKPALPIINRAHPMSRGLVGCWAMYGEGTTKFRELVTGAWAIIAGAPASFAVGPYGKYAFQGIGVGYRWQHTEAESAKYRFTQADNWSTFSIGWNRAMANFRNVFRCDVGDSGGATYWLLWQISTGALVFQSPGFSVTSSATIAVDTWFSVGTSVNNNQWARLYINGAYDNEDNTIANWSSGATDVLSGLGSSAGGSYWYGGMAVQLIWRDRVLTADEHLSLYLDPYQIFTVPNYTIVATAEATSSTVQLSWTDNSGGAQTFNIERSVTSAYSGFSEIATGETGPTYSDTELSADTYWYRIRGYTGTEYTDYSNVVEITVTT